MWVFSPWILLLLLASLVPLELSAQEAPDEGAGIQRAGQMEGGGGAEASNPLAAVNSIDLKWTYSRLTDPNSSRSNLYWIKGSHSFTQSMKLSYELA